MLTCPACGRKSPPDASFCVGCGAPLGATATAHETRKTVTALFCDLVGSTALGEQHDPEVLRGALERYFDLVQATVERHGGRVEKYVGDAVNGVFGLPVAHEDDALRAVRAGVEIQAGLAGLAATSLVPIAARVGIHTGEVLAPGTGRPLIGDTMNTASRLQSSAEPGSVIIGEPTFRLVRDAVVAEPVEPLVLKGKAEPVPAYRVVAVASLSPMRTRRLDAPMVGRRREASLLEDAFERAASDRACVLFTVLGSAGAGKSRLVEEFLGAWAGTDAEILRGRCLPYGDGITWYPVTEALRGALDLPEFAEADAIRSAIAAAVDGEEHAAALEANLTALFAVGPGGTAEETAWAIRRFLESRGRERPLVLVLDDIHWGEPAFLDLVEHVADWSRDASILLLCMARPDLLDIRPAWGGGKTNATTISLAPLSGTETDALLDGLLGSSALPAKVRSRITQVAEGNPLFVEEMIRMLVDDGRLVRDDGGWVVAGDLADVAVPPTVSALLSARLDRLSDGERAAVEAASVAGKEFHRGSVAALLPEPVQPDLSVHLRSLTRKELITPERSSLPGEDAYRFRHLLIRDAAYDAIPKSARSGLHRAFADWLEGVAGDRIAEQRELLGYHLERAYRYREELGLPEDRELRLRAGRALGAAGSRALDRGDVRAAIDLLRSAAALTQGDPAELEILDNLGAAIIWGGNTDELPGVVTRLEDAAIAWVDPVYTMRARTLQLAEQLSGDPKSFDLDAARSMLEDALRTARLHGGTRLETIALNWLVNVAIMQGDAATGLRYASEVLELAPRLGERFSTGWAAANVLRCLVAGPAPSSVALAKADALVERFSEEPWVQEAVLSTRADLNARIGRVEAAMEDAVAARAIADEIGLRDAASAQSAVAAWVAWCQGDLETAASHFQATIAAMVAARDGLNPGEIAPSLARVLLALGRDDEAAASVHVLEPYGSWLPEGAELLSLGGVLAARRRDWDKAFSMADEGWRRISATDFLANQGEIALDRAEVLQLAGRPAEARASAADALERFERKEHAIGIRRAREMLERLSA